MADICRVDLQSIMPENSMEKATERSFLPLFLSACWSGNAPIMRWCTAYNDWQVWFIMLVQHQLYSSSQHICPLGWLVQRFYLMLHLVDAARYLLCAHGVQWTSWNRPLWDCRFHRILWTGKNCNLQWWNCCLSIYSACWWGQNCRCVRVESNGAMRE